MSTARSDSHGQCPSHPSPRLSSRWYLFTAPSGSPSPLPPAPLASARPRRNEVEAGNGERAGVRGENVDWLTTFSRPAKSGCADSLGLRLPSLPPLPAGGRGRG